jgi:hypothetical protein
MSVVNLSSDYVVAAYVWPAYHDEPRWRPFFSGTEGEWEIIRNASKKGDPDLEINKPLWGYESDADPIAMAKKIDAAVSHGVNAFIFDWYWYDNAPFLEDSLNKGFLQAENCSTMNFYLMWANHNASTLWDIRRSDDLGQVIWPGAVDRATFDTVVDRVIDKYMKHPSYLKIDGCPVFMIYELGTLIDGLGGINATRDALDSFRKKVKAAGFPNLHVQTVLWSMLASPTGVPGDETPTAVETVKLVGIDSLTSYQWVHTQAPPDTYESWGRNAVARWQTWSAEYPVPYYPHVSIGWNTNPRFMAKLPVISERSPKMFAEFLQQAKDFVDSNHLNPRLITVNSWNEWSEGSCLEPDERFGMGYLEAVKAVFSPGASASH